MKLFVAIEEDLLEKLWLENPDMVVPFSRPFIPRDLNQWGVVAEQEAKALLPAEQRVKDESVESGQQLLLLDALPESANECSFVPSNN